MDQVAGPVRDQAAGRAATDKARHERLDALIERRLAPLLPELAAMQRRYRWGTLGAIGGCSLLLVLTITAVMEPFILFSAAGLFFAIGALLHFSRVFRDRVRTELMPLVCEAIGGITHQVGHAEALMRTLTRLPLVAPFGQTTIDDVFTGSHDATAFTMAEVRLFNRTTRVSGTGSKRTTSTSEHTVFQGLIFSIATPSPVPVRIVIRGPRLMFAGRWRLSDKALRAAGYQRVAVPDSAFSRHLALWADDPAGALEIVGPHLAAILTRLATTAGRRRIDAGLAATSFLLLLPRRGNQFTSGGLFRPLSKLRHDAHALMEEVMVIHRLIDVLKGAPSRPAGAAG